MSRAGSPGRRGAVLCRNVPWQTSENPSTGSLVNRGKGKGRAPKVRDPSPRSSCPPRFDPGSCLTCWVNPKYSVPNGSGKQEKYAEQGEPDRPQHVPDHHDVCSCLEPDRFERADE
jgi:hypothetical protein